MKKFNMRSYALEVFIAIALLTVLSEVTRAQSYAVGDTFFASIPDTDNLQGLAMQRQDSSLIFYVGFDTGSRGLYEVYKACDSGGVEVLDKINCFKTTGLLHHPNDLNLIGDTLLVTGEEVYADTSYVGYVDPVSGTVLKIFFDTTSGMWLQFCYAYHDTVFAGITDYVNLNVQYFQSRDTTNKEVPPLNLYRFFYYASIVPSPFRTTTNYVQGSKVILGHYLAFITSGPTRLDIYDLDKGFAYVKSIYTGGSSGEAEGLATYEDDDSVFVFYGIRPPNRINTFAFSKHPKPPVLKYPGDSSSVHFSSLQFKWNPLNEAASYIIQLSKSNFIGPFTIDEQVQDTTTTVTGLDSGAVYYWRVGAITLAGDTIWSPPDLFRAVLPTGLEQVARTNPSSFFVDQNYPNPFNPSTTIEFGISQSCHVNISVYNAIGEKMAQLVEQKLVPGTYRAHLDASRYSTGVYFCRVTAGGYTKVEKMVLTK